MSASLRIFVLSSRLIILVILLIILTVIDIGIESVYLASAINHVLIEFVNTRALMNLKISHGNDPVPQGIIVFTIEFLMQRVH